MPTDVPVALLLRHAERPAIQPGESGNELLLTQHGWETSKLLGEQLGGRLQAINTSPLPRCWQTGWALLVGSGSQAPIVIDRLLGDPGVFVEDPDLAWGNWTRLGHPGVVEHLIAGDGPLPGLRDAADAAQELANHLVGCLQRESTPEVHVFITHDAILAPLVARLQGRPLLPEEWPTFLEAAAIWACPAGMRLAYRTQVDLVPGCAAGHEPATRLES